MHSTINFAISLEALKPKMLSESIYSIAIFGIVLYLAAQYVKWRVRSSTLAKLGATPPMVSFRLPWGFDTLLETIDVTLPITDTDVLVQ